MKKILFPLVMILTLACTVGIYYLLFDQQTTTLFYINTVTTCVAEVLLLVNVPMWSGCRLLTLTNASVSIFVEWYAVLMFIWATLFTLAIYHPRERAVQNILHWSALADIVVCGAGWLIGYRSSYGRENRKGAGGSNGE